MKFNIKETREKLGWTQEVLADKVCVTVVTLSRWENEKTNPTRNSVKKIERIFEDGLAELEATEKAK